MAAFTLYDLADGEPVGTASLMAIDWRLSRATFVRHGAVVSLGERSDELLMDAIPHEFDSPVLAARR